MSKTFVIAPTMMEARLTALDYHIDPHDPSVVVANGMSRLLGERVTIRDRVIVKAKERCNPEVIQYLRAAALGAKNRIKWEEVP